MYGAFFKIVSKPGKMAELLDFLRWDAVVAEAAEPGTLRFDVWNVPGEPDALYVYEAYANSAAFARHQANKPYQRYVSHVEPQLLQPEGRRDLFGFTESIISNAPTIGFTNSAGTTAPKSNPQISKLSFVSFPTDSDALHNFNHYGELRRLTRGRDASVAHVHFPPGVRTHWHHHEGEQLLWFIEGKGRVVLRDESTLECRAGDIVRVSAGASHWHGASAGEFAVHIAITTGLTVWEGAVADSGRSVNPITGCY